MKHPFFFILLLACTLVAATQPYVDPFQVRYTHAFRSSGTSKGTPFDHLWMGSDVPIKLKEKTYILLSPYFESWHIDSASKDNIVPTVKSIALPVGLLLPLRNEKWSVAITQIIRTNGENLFGKNTFQIGGASFFSYEKSQGKKLRFGFYFNADFFGYFFMPLLGADWKIDDKNYLFGLLPGRLTWEHKLSNAVYAGMTFRAITNSYRLSNQQYLRIDDNQLSAYFDLYPVKPVCFTLESGYGISRKLRTGSGKRNYFNAEKWGDSFFIKLSAAYRLRFENMKQKS